MLIYNTTYHVDDEIHENFVIWLKEYYMQEVAKDAALHSPRLLKVLSHREEGTTYSLQWEVENSTVLHRWHSQNGAKYNDEMLRIFGSKVVGFPTLMEVIE
ncbi:DUF4286 family protein [Bacteroides sp. 214]|uniref:DUF4286 family protein n=1 Tax=Bacteroides sp. 214 TaxID=2302935 RepID=UPI0013D47FEF|nr:DUF4286 family protein [Bacteroides sp. 214]NDW11287.1 DUF4286 family protein [Bacteroides sp. 214]